MVIAMVTLTNLNLKRKLSPRPQKLRTPIQMRRKKTNPNMMTLVTIAKVYNIHKLLITCLHTKLCFTHEVMLRL